MYVIMNRWRGHGCVLPTEIRTSCYNNKVADERCSSPCSERFSSGATTLMMMLWTPASGSHELGIGTVDSRDGCGQVRVRVVERDCLRAIGVCAENTGCENVKRAAEKNIVGGRANDMEL